MFGKYVFGGRNGELNGFIRFDDIKLYKSLSLCALIPLENIYYVRVSFLSFSSFYFAVDMRTTMYNVLDRYTETHSEMMAFKTWNMG